MILDLVKWSALLSKKGAKHHSQDDPLIQVSTAIDIIPHSDHTILAQRINDMFDTMYSLHGIGLAGVQVGYLQRVFVLDIPKYSNGGKVFINPEIMEFSRDLIEHEEGCLSIPEIHAKVKRPRTVRVRYYDIEFKQREDVFSDLYAVCIQHEIDHLDGILFLERIAKRAVAKVKKQLLEQGYQEVSLTNFPFSQRCYTLKNFKANKKAQ